MQDVTIQLFDMRVSLGNIKEQCIGISDALVFRGVRKQLLPLFLQCLPFLAKPLHHFVEQVIAQVACGVIPISPLNHFNDTLGLGFDVCKGLFLILHAQ